MRAQAVESNGECILYPYRHICCVAICVVLCYLAAWDPPRPGKAAWLPSQHLMSKLSFQLQVLISAHQKRGLGLLEPMLLRA
jgi:hypothetical protein